MPITIDPARSPEIREHFRTVGADYEAVSFPGGHQAVSERELAQVRAAIADLPLASRVLEAGAGTGRVSAVLASRGFSLTLVDAEPAMTGRLRERFPTSPVIDHVLGESPLPFEDGAFDAVVSIRVLKWVPRWQAALADLARVVRPGGRVVVEITNRWSLAGLGYRRSPVTPVSAREFRRAASAAGLDVIAAVPGTRAPFPVWTAVGGSARATSLLLGAESVLDRTVGTAGARSILFVADRRDGER